MPKDIKIIPFELNLTKEKWMFMCIYRPPAQNKQYFLENLSMIADHYARIYYNHIILGDFNMEPNSPILISFMILTYINLFNIIKSKTFVRVLDAHAPRKLKFYVVFIKLMLTKIFVKSL